MVRAATAQDRRSGKIVVLLALLLLPVIAFLALAIDIGYIAGTRAELQSVADAVALAAAAKLLDRDELTGSPNQETEIAAARAAALRYGKANEAGGKPLDLDPNQANDAHGDVVVGHISNPADLNSAMTFNSGPKPLVYSPSLQYLLPTVGLNVPFVTPPPVTTSYRSYNSVQVRLQRSKQRNGSLDLFFAQALGRDTAEVQATATATYEDDIKGFRFDRTTPRTSRLLPFAMDVNTFGAVAAGQSILDLYRYDKDKPVVTAVYPGPPPRPGDYSARVSFARPEIDPDNLSPVFNLNAPDLRPVVPYQASLTGFAANTAFNPPNLLDPAGAVKQLFPGDGIKEGLLVPLAVQTRLPVIGDVSVGNLASLYVGTTPSTPLEVFERQVLYGLTETDFAAWGGKFELGGNGTLAVKGDTVVNSALKQVLGKIKGQPRIIPLFRPKPQALLPQVLGREVDVEIVGFAGIIFLEVLDIEATPALPGIQNPLTGQYLVQPLPGTPKTLRLLFQPEFVIDATAVGGGTGTSRFVYRPLRLTR